MAAPLLRYIREMKTSMRSDRGFSINELMLTVAVAATLMAIAVPILTDVGEGARFNASVRVVERELQSARLKAVNANTVLRVRTNCPSAGYMRTIEVVGNAAVDGAMNRCDTTVYPFPAPDTEMTTRPNHDGPVRVLPAGTTVGDIVLQFSPDGTVTEVVSNVPQRINGDVSNRRCRGRPSERWTAACRS